MHCQQCGQILEERDLDREKFIANCRNCYAISDFSNMPDMVRENTLRKQSSVPMPEGVTMETQDRHLVIKCRWYSKYSSIRSLINSLGVDTFLIYFLVTKRL
ncbi:MAG: hypothetical protein ABRQ39_07535 [Candidatus Eremiobacterota bacterium]